MDLENTVTGPNGDAVRGEVVDAAPAPGGEGRREEAGGFSSPAANKSFARLRRERDRLAKELASAKTGQAGETAPPNAPDAGVSAEDAFAKALPNAPDEGEESGRANRTDLPPDAFDPGLSMMAGESLSAGVSPETAALLRERATLQGLLYEGQFEKDLQQLKGLFPLEKVAHVSELGEDFMALRAAGVDNITAFVAVRLSQSAGRPPEAGAVSAAASDGEGFFTSREVDFLSEKELSDPKVLKKAIQSMTKWK